MPQMKPLLWTLIVSILMMYLLFTMSNIKPLPNYFPVTTKINKKENCMKW